MSLQLLRRLAGEALPVTISDPSEVDTVRVLRASDCLLCLMFKGSSGKQEARVLTITPAGKEALSRGFVPAPAANDAVGRVLTA